jgi:chlorophyll synthase
MIHYVRILRPHLWVPSIVSMLIGFVFTFNAQSLTMLTILRLILAVAITGPLIAGSALVLNQYFDVPLDRRARVSDKFPLVMGEFRARTALVYAVFLLALGLLIASVVNLDVFIVTSLAVTLAVLYSVPPFRFKSRVLIDSLTNGVSYGILPTLVGAALVSESLSRGLLISIPLLVGYTAGHMLLAIPDIENDRRFGLRTTAVVLGYRRTVVLATVMFTLMFFVLGIYMYADFVPPLTGLFVYPIGALILWEQANLVSARETIRERSYGRLSIEFLALAAVFLVGLLLTGV